MSEIIKSHKDLDIWKNSIDLVIKTYMLTKAFPEDERFGLINQMRRASISIPSNIAEGAARKTYKEFINFLFISTGSLSELETQFIIAHKLNYIRDISTILQEIRSLILMIKSLIKKLQTKT